MSDRKARKYSGAKAALRKDCQGKTARGLRAQARRQVGNLAPASSFSRVTGRSIGSFTSSHGRVIEVVKPVAVEAVKPATDCCDSCGKQVRLRVNGAMYAHKCIQEG